jgi:hypothetical protein
MICIAHHNMVMILDQVQSLLNARRTADHSSDLWTTLNVVQENLMRSGQR